MYHQNFQNFDQNVLLKCSLCTYSTEKKTNLQRHQQTMHLQTHKELFCCDISFLDKASYRDHNRAEHKFGHKCSTCDRTFSRRALLRRHQSVHTGVREFSCHLCPYASSHKSNLERHAKIHWRNQQPDSTTGPTEEKSKISTKTLKISHSIESILRKNDQKIDDQNMSTQKPNNDHGHGQYQLYPLLYPIEFNYLQNYFNYFYGLFGQNLNHPFYNTYTTTSLGQPQPQNQQLTNFNFNYNL